MSAARKLVVDADLLGAIGELLLEPKRAVSPFHAVGGRPPTPAQLERLRALGVLTAAGEVAGGMRRTLAVLASSRAFARVQVLGGVAAFGCDLWFGEDGGPPVSVMSGPAGLVVQDPAPVDEVLAWLGQMLGASAMGGGDWEATAGPAEALVLAAMLDRQRRTVLRAVADATPVQPEVVGAEALAADLAAAGPGAGGAGAMELAGLVATAWGAQLRLTAAEVARAMVTLAGGGRVRPVPGGYQLGPAEQGLAERVLLIERVVRLDAGRELQDGTIARAGLTCVQAGVHDLVRMERVGDQLHLETSSAAALLDDLEALLRQPYPSSDDAEPIAATRELRPEHWQVASEPAAAQPAMVGAGGRWAPTHVVPSGGLPTWERPDASLPSTVRLDPWLEVRILERTGDWAHVVCSNGWAAWVDARELRPVGVG